MESGSLTLFAAYCFTGPSGTIDPRTHSGIISRSTSICCGQEGHASDRSSSDAPGLELPRLQFKPFEKAVMAVTTLDPVQRLRC